jgi:hypothetical protein
MALNDYEMSFRGLTFGGSTALGIKSIDGLQDFDASLGDTPIPRGDGDIPGLHRVAGKTITLELVAKGVAKSQALADTLAAAAEVFQRSTMPERLYFKLPGQSESFVWARCIGRAIKQTPDVAFGARPLLVRLKAADPRVYGVTQQNETLGVYDGSGGGSDLDFDFPVDFSVDTSAEAIVTNNGDFNSYPLLRFYGPTTGTVTAVKLTNVTTGQVTEFETTIITGQILTADMRRIVTADTGDDPYVSLDGSSRYGDWVLPRTPFALAPGDNALRFEVTGTSVDALCVVTHRDTSL